MGADGEFDIDPNLADTGAFGLAEAGGFMICGVCCPCDCVCVCNRCGDSQPGLTVVIDDGCSDPDCQDAELIDTWWKTDGGDYCVFSWKDGDGADPYALNVGLQCLPPDVISPTCYWRAEIVIDSLVAFRGYEGDGSSTFDITCAGGELSGTFSIPGRNTGFGGPQCEGCTATVVIG